MVIVITLCLISTGIFAQEITVNGSVQDASGEPVIGATILVKGTTNGTTTDIDGQYELANVGADTVLVFSYVGMKSQEVMVNAQNRIDVVLEEGAIGLEEVVVVGYGTQRKSDLTGSIASADIEAFRESPNVNIMQSLQGSVPGVQIGQVNQAGEEPSIQVRGQSTLNGSTSPLIVVDGIIFRGRIADLNPADIASVDVLKDASSKAIYGAQAANGVILITTKEGKVSQKPTIQYSGSISTQNPTVDARILNREEVLQKIKDIEYRNAYLGPGYTEPNPDWEFDQSELLPKLLSGIENGTDYDWWGALTSPGHIMNHVLSISGGSENTNYYLSGGYTDQKGFILNDNYSRATARINIETDLTNWLTVGTNTYASFADFSGVYPNINGISRGTSPLVAPKDQNGELIVNHLGDNNVNPFLNAQADDRDLNNRVSGNLFAKIKVPQIKGLSYQLNFNNNLNWFSHSTSNIYGAGLSGAASKAHASNYDVMLDNILTYNREFNNHSVNFTLVAGYNKVKFDRTYAGGENIPNLSLSYNSLEQSIIREINSDAWEQVSTYQMGRFNYNFKNRYILTGTLRRDGFSGFSANNKFGLFPSLGAGWVVSEESFFSMPNINFLKIRASYGQNGNQAARYSSLARVLSSESNHYVYGDGSGTSLGLSPASLANSDLSWETSTGLNLGVDFGVINERVRGNIEYYSTATTDLLWDLRLPQITGFSQITTNLGRIENRGFEVSLQTIPVQKKNFRWNLNLNFSRNQNKIVELLQLDNNGDGKEDDLVASGLFIGESIGTIYGYEIDGIWQVNDEIQEGFSPGTYRIVDQNNDGAISASDDRVILGRSEPAFRFGIQNTFRYKGLSLRIFVNSIQGGKNGYLGANHPSGVAGTPGTAQNSNWFTFYDYWSTLNPDGKYPRTWEAAQIKPSQYFSRSFVRLQDLSLSYSFKKSTLEQIGINNTKIYVSGKNVLTLTKWDGWDPETNQGIGNANAFPLMKAYTLGLDISF
ncbi:SusC/RagA family TonB-linked outer membrane protein [Membranihabitans maritimus]|uniref:SusC/RagA family TonB-linked outer membrane protein n=1 Tax=Membranihabitans maritimus TaxID=2904244 RepID=UPI001F1D480C|nr:TonB-dependent receptor [Membranihabitans maritimus]